MLVKVMVVVVVSGGVVNSVDLFMSATLPSV